MWPRNGGETNEFETVRGVTHFAVKGDGFDFTPVPVLHRVVVFRRVDERYDGGQAPGCGGFEDVPFRDSTLQNTLLVLPSLRHLDDLHPTVPTDSLQQG